MTGRTLKIALAVSLAVNLFVLGVLGGGLFMASQLMRELRDVGGPHPVRVIGVLPDAERDAARERMREAARLAMPELRQARQARREAARLASAETFDRAAIEAALARAYASEGRGRAALDDGLLDILSGLEADQRAELAPALLGRRVTRRMGRGEGPPSPDQP